MRLSSICLAALSLSFAVACSATNDASSRSEVEPAGATSELGTTVTALRSRLSASAQHTCLVTGGAVKCWGSNSVGQTGAASPDPDATLKPTLVPGTDTGWVAVSTADDHTCALSASGMVRCWGWNDEGQIGIGNASRTAVPPTNIFGIGVALDLSVSGQRTCAVTVQGDLRCWGRDLVRGQEEPARSPRAMKLPVLATSVSLRGTGGGCVTAAVGTALREAFCVDSHVPHGSLRCNEGAGDDGLCTNISTRPEGHEVTQVRSNGPRSCSLTTDGRVHCPVRNYAAIGIVGAIAISVGSQDVCAVLGNGHVACTPTSYQPDTVATEIAGITNAVEIAMGPSHTCVLRTTGEVACWGDNTFGQLGTGNHTSSTEPVTVDLD